MESALHAGAGEPGLKLIETLLWDGGRFPRLALHLDRLAAAARLLGWPPAAAEATLARISGPAARVRLTLDAAGRVEVTAAPLVPMSPFWRLGLAEARLRCDDPWLRVKSTRRPLHDAARAALPADREELIFLNERGEVCEGTITTLFFDRGQGLRTPPLACGLLPGVLRAELAAPEEILLAEDLPRVRLWVGNALRGLIPSFWMP